MRSQIGRDPLGGKFPMKEVVLMVEKKINDADTFGADDLDDGALEVALRESFPNMAESSAEDATARIATRLLKAGTMDQRFDALSGNSTDALIGKSFEITGVQWQTYASERGDVPQGVVQAVDLSTGEATEFVTTATMLVYFLRSVEMGDDFPFKARIVEKTTKRGNKALNFERA